MLAPPVFAFGKTKHKEVSPVENQEVIHLDVTKNDSDLSEENQIPENPKQKNDDWVQDLLTMLLWRH